MVFFKWPLSALFGTGTPDPTPATEDRKRVPKWCKAGRSGKVIVCPDCGGKTRVHNFSWTALACPHCKKETGKYDWFLGPDDK